MELAPTATANFAGASTRISERNSGDSGLGSQDFLKLLITQLTNQDPLEPTGNEELLRQIASIREIELSSTLTDSLRSLTDQQRFLSVPAMIGQHVTGIAGDNGTALSGIVIGVRFAENGRPVLRLSNGAELPLERVLAIQSPGAAAQALLGSRVRGVDLREPSSPRVVEGTVTGIVEKDGEVHLELDSGEDLRLRDVTDAATMSHAG